MKVGKMIVQKSIKVLFLLFIIIGVMGFACDTYTPAPLQQDQADIPDSPTHLSAQLGEDSIILSWRFDGGTQIKEFRVYRNEAGAGSSFLRLGQTDSTRYIDSTVTDGQQYFYRVAAVNQQGFEGEHSRTINVVPSVYSIILQAGVQTTNQQKISISIAGPQDSKFMMLSNDSLFENANWEPFATSREWQLSPGDGLKTVFAKFRTGNDLETAQPVSAKIILDTIATIEYISDNSNGRALQSGDTLHIRLKSGELNGSATASIFDPSYNVPGRGEENLRLYDDGSHGDSVADDGIYETDYFIGHGIEVENAFLFGYFTDAVGNVAERAVAQNQLTVNQAPRSVVLQEPTLLDADIPSIVLRWSANSDVDFSSYQILRSKSYLVSLSSFLVQEIKDARMTSFIDEGLEPATQYYYRVYVFDASGNSTASNIVSATTLDNIAPKPVVLSQPSADSVGLLLTWSPSSEKDFANYRLYRSTSLPVDTSFAPIHIFNDSNITEYQDSSVSLNIDYYYQIFVFDKYGLSAGSNEVKGRKNP